MATLWKKVHLYEVREGRKGGEHTSSDSGPAERTAPTPECHSLRYKSMNQRNNSKTINLTWRNGMSAAFNSPPLRQLATPFVTDTLPARAAFCSLMLFLFRHSDRPKHLKSSSRPQKHCFSLASPSVTFQPCGVEWCECRVPHKVKGKEKKKGVCVRPQSLHKE